MRVTINKCTLSGTINAPASKSFGHRLMICAALSGGVSHVSGISDCEDMLATLDCISALGAKYEKNGGAVTIYGVPRPKNIMSTFPCCINDAAILSHITVVSMPASDNSNAVRRAP